MLLSIYSVPAPVLGPGDIAGNEADELCALVDFTLSVFQINGEEPHFPMPDKWVITVCGKCK